MDGIYGGGGAADPVNLLAGAVIPAGKELSVPTLNVTYVQDLAGTNAQFTSSASGPYIPAGKSITTRVLQSHTDAPLYVQTQGDQHLYLQAYGDGTGDTADIYFNAGNANRAYISQAGYLIMQTAGAGIGADIITDRTGALAPSAPNGFQVGNSDGDKLYFGSTSNYLEWDTATNGLLLNGDASARIDLDNGIMAAYQYIGTEIANPGAAAAGTFRLYRESTGDTVDVQTETSTSTIHTE